MSVSEIREDLKYISDKRPLLSNQGVKLSDIYYNSLNSVVDTVECTFTQGRILQSLPSLTFGGSSQITIPIGSFLGETYLHLRLPNLVNDQCLPRGWGLACIQSISYIFGSSNVSQVTLNRQSIVQTLLAQSETSDKSSEWFNLAGECLTGPLPSGQFPEADVLLPFPWSNMSSLFPKKPYDTTLLSNPITITIQFEQASAIFGGVGAKPSGFLEASVSYRTGDLAQKELSLRNALMQNPSLMYTYPFIYQQSYVSQSFLGSTDPNSPCTIQIQQFINADLVGMTLCVVKQSDVAPSGNSTPNPFNWDQISNLVLNLNGQNIYVAPGKQYKLINMQSSMGASYFNNALVAPGSSAPFTVTPVSNYPVFVDFSRQRSAQFTNQFFNVWRIGNNTMQVQFNTSTAGVAYNLYVTMLYNAVIESSNGESRMYIS